jgi:hypothetical protein
MYHYPRVVILIGRDSHCRHECLHHDEGIGLPFLHLHPLPPRPVQSSVISLPIPVGREAFSVCWPHFYLPSYLVLILKRATFRSLFLIPMPRHGLSVATTSSFHITVVAQLLPGFSIVDSKRISTFDTRTLSAMITGRPLLFQVAGYALSFPLLP